MHGTPRAPMPALRRITRMAALLWISAAAAGQSFAAPPAKAFSQAYSLVHQSLQHFQAGDHGAALNSLKAAHGLMLTQPTQFSAAERQRVTALIGSLADHPPIGTAGSRKPLEVYRETLISLDPLQHPLRHRWAPSAPASATRVLQTAWHAVPKPTFVTANVAQFGHDFRAGANAPQQTLIDEKYRWHFDRVSSTARASALATHLSQANATLIDGWLAVPQERRVFVIGARDDGSHVELLRQRHPTLVFAFYRDCEPQCRESTIGALFGSAGTVIGIDSPNARRSPFIPVEVGLVVGRRLWLIDGDEARRLMNHTGNASLAITLASCSLDASVREEAACS